MASQLALAAARVIVVLTKETPWCGGGGGGEGGGGDGGGDGGGLGGGGEGEHETRPWVVVTVVPEVVAPAPESRQSPESCQRVMYTHAGRRTHRSAHASEDGVLRCHPSGTASPLLYLRLPVSRHPSVRGAPGGHGGGGEGGGLGGGGEGGGEGGGGVMVALVGGVFIGVGFIAGAASLPSGP